MLVNRVMGRYTVDHGKIHGRRQRMIKGRQNSLERLAQREMQNAQENITNVEPVSLDGLEDVFISTDDQGTIDRVSSEDRRTNKENAFPEGGLKLSEAADKYKVTVRTVQRWIKEGKLEAFKVEGSHGPEWRVIGESSVDTGSCQPTIGTVDQSDIVELSPDNEHASSFMSGSSESIDRMAGIIEKLTEQLESAHKDLQGASFRNGYLEAQLAAKDEHIKLLTDSQHKSGGWWISFCDWMMGKKA